MKERVWNKLDDLKVDRKESSPFVCRGVTSPDMSLLGPAVVPVSTSVSFRGSPDPVTTVVLPVPTEIL